MHTKETTQKTDTKKQINIWLDSAVLLRWDAYCTYHDATRAQLIKTAVNEYIEKKATDLPTNNDGVSRVIEAQFKELKETLKVKPEMSAPQSVIVNDRSNRERILKVLERGPADSETLSLILGISEMIVVEILSEMKNDGLVKMDKEATWHVANEE